MNKEQAFVNFWESFDIPAYEINTVKKEAKLPYFTYEVNIPDRGYQAPFSVNIYFKNSGWEKVTEQANIILDRITHGGININYNGGSIWLKRGDSNLMQRMNDPKDDTIKCIVLNLVIEC